MGQGGESGESVVGTPVLSEPNVWRKIRRLERALDAALEGRGEAVALRPARDVAVVPIRELPPKAGLKSDVGQARLLHDLASIELQAMELGLRTLLEFPAAPEAFREELARVTREEGAHLRLCLEGLDQLGFPWGSWPVHIGLWQSVSADDSLLDRILIVHRYLEGSGLDAGDTLRRRLMGVERAVVHKIAERIHRDELEHVRFGSDWYRRICRAEGIDPDEDFGARLMRIFSRLPRRLEPIVEPLRREAGFSGVELQRLKEAQGLWKRASELPPIHLSQDRSKGQHVEK